MPIGVWLDAKTNVHVHYDVLLLGIHMDLVNVAQKCIFTGQEFLAMRAFDCHRRQAWAKLATPQVPLHVVSTRKRLLAAMNFHQTVKSLFLGSFVPCHS